MKLSDWGFQRLFEQAFVYNILWEDTEVDETHLHVDESSRILAISGAGCGVANHLSRHPRRIDAVDINRHHLALTALKVAANRSIPSHGEYYELLGHGRHPNPERAVGELAATLPVWVQRYWAKRWPLFNRSMIKHGVTARMLETFRLLTGVDASWLKHRFGETLDERRAALRAVMEPLLDRPLIHSLLGSPFTLFALGINFSQRERIEEAEGASFSRYLMTYLERVCATDLERNWFVWYVVTGGYEHASSDALPPLLREASHERALGADTEVAFHNDNVFDVLHDASASRWTHFTLCDAVDWMPRRTQRHLFEEILRTSVDGARVLYRSVQDESLIERHGLERHFQLDVAASDAASRADQTKLYRRVNFYTVCH